MPLDLLQSSELLLTMDQGESLLQEVKLYQPYEAEQILLPESASCLSVHAFFKMCGLDFQVEQRSNAEYMSPSGRVPFIKCQQFVVAELNPIVQFVAMNGVSLSSKLDSGQKADMRAYTALVNSVLTNAELYVSWCESTTFRKVTKPRFGSVLPWPLNHLITRQKRCQVMKKLGVLGWASKSLYDVLREVDDCCRVLSDRLEGQAFFFGGSPTELDALLYGHLSSILTTFLPIPGNRIANIVQHYQALVSFVKNVDQKYFGCSQRMPREILTIAEPPPVTEEEEEITLAQEPPPITEEGEEITLAQEPPPITEEGEEETPAEELRSSDGEESTPEEPSLAAEEGEALLVSSDEELPPEGDEQAILGMYVAIGVENWAEEDEEEVAILAIEEDTEQEGLIREE